MLLAVFCLKFIKIICRPNIDAYHDKSISIYLTASIFLCFSHFFLLFSFTLSYLIFSRYETTNGIKAQEDGISYPGNVPESGNYVRSGSYSYEWEGVTYTVTWTADENGFHPEGDHLPDFSHTREHIADISDLEK